MAPSTSQGKWFPSPILTTYAFQFNFGDSDSRYMTTSGPSPMFKEIGSKYDGPIDIAMISIWRGSTLSFIARLGSRVRFFSFILLPKPSHPQKLTEYIIPHCISGQNAMHFATLAGSDQEALEPIIELKQAKRAMEMVTCGESPGKRG